ncbi:MAG: winged helix-turn-helix domain-containing protein [Pseudomonadota bacterium]
MKLQLGDWIIQEHANLLTRDEKVVRLEKRVMAVLMQLIEANGSVVAKEELIDKVWNGAAVSDHSVANAISDLRRALGDDRKNPNYIETIPKRGYRLIQTAQTISADNAIEDDKTAGAQAPQHSMAHAWTLVAATLLIGVVIAIVFLRPTPPARLFLTDIENATGQTRHDLAANAATEMLTVSLSGGDLRLVRWRAPFTAASDIQTTGHDRIVSGRIINDGATAILALDVVDPADGASIWAGAYPITGANFAALAAAIAADLREPLKISPPLSAYAAADPEIAEAYWRARYLWSLREHQAIRHALRILEGVAIKAPDYAPAHAAIADIYAHKTAEELGLERSETYPLAEHHLARAFALNPDLAEAFITRAYLAFFRDRDTPRAMAEIDKAIKAQPANAVAWQTKGMIASAAGEARISLQAIKRAHDLDPLSAGVAWDRVWFLYVAGRPDEALAAAQNARRIAPPVHVYEALIHLARNDELAAFESWLNHASARGLSNEREAEIRAIANKEGARRGLSAIAAAAASSDANPQNYRQITLPHAALLAALDQHDTAVGLLLNNRPAEKSWWWSWYDVMPGIDPLRHDPRLQSLTITPVAIADG